MSAPVRRSPQGEGGRSAPPASLKEFALAGLIVLAATIVVTWPLAPHFTSRLTGNWDAFFGAWRLAWIADAVVSPDLRIFEAPIFYPEPRALAFSDAILLPGLVAAPLRYIGLAPLVAYNLALFAAFVLSGVALYALARSLGLRSEAALIGAVIYALAPYRLDHLDHFEMQVAMWMPIALLWWHRTVDGGSATAAGGVVSAVVLQWFSCIYYGVLFAPVLLAGIAVEWTAIAKEKRPRVLIVMSAVAAAGLFAIYWYSLPYLANRETTGDRLSQEVGQYSGTLASYLTVHPRNALWGSVPALNGLYETRLFPGVAALAFAAIALGRGSWNRRRWAYLAMGAVAFDLSLGTNGLLFPLLREYVLPYRGLRAPARAGVVVLLIVSVLAAFGAQRIFDRARTPRARLAMALAAGVFLLVEYRTPPDLWETTSAPNMPQIGLTRSAVMLEMPIAAPERFDLSRDADYMYTRIGQWPHLVNGYSGYYPQAYVTMAERTKLFPDTRAIREIARIGTTVLTVHERWYGPQYRSIIAALDQRTDVSLLGKYRDEKGEVAVYHVKPLIP